MLPVGSELDLDRSVLRAIRQQAVPLTGELDQLDGLLEMIGDAGVVLLGEASHGTHEFYHLRAELTRRLIVEKDFAAVAVEADWPDAWRVNRYVLGDSDDCSAVEALRGFERFPEWMWRNTEVLDFVAWLRDHNANVATEEGRTGFYGLDLYSLHRSMSEVIDYLSRVDPEAAERARIRYGCLDRHGPDPQNYGLLAISGVDASCREEVSRQLAELRAMEAELLSRDGRPALDAYFFAEQNARLVANAEAYYRQIFRSDVSTWNLRDQHMMETLVELMAHLQTVEGRAKVVVWAHNSHLGDARATAMARRGERNLGQLVRETFATQSRLIGFTTYAGTVTAATGWHSPGRQMSLRPGQEGSYEKLFHQVGIPAFWLDLSDGNPAALGLREPRLERAIGVVYRPEREARSHYFEACLGRQFDAVIHQDLTRAVEVLDHPGEWPVDEAPETFPHGL
ncbi:MAG: erythromycin esterase family protein [Verrucomicrobia bacterium]|nr:MAG: erythromycin esterase family protein [Verrucomicrobiota bacterium]TAE89216.1 MAG: erythromycin esterase family protein [Verrucomicrobiota bacterium]TAF27908.1 MAG: erythromycin esterase family protein [Verrucomicrobiota bacterium]TAF42757.1 MAG: erythromycin esterase family protein [Verrucomicrobiota bacterium]